MASTGDSWPELTKVREEKLKTLRLTGEEISNRMKRSRQEHFPNPIVELPEALFQLTSLETLEITDTSLNWLPYDLQKLENLEKAIFSKNQIDATSEWFNDMPKMTLLDMSHNLFEVVPEEFNIPSVEVCDISHNKLCVFPDISPANKLKNLILHHNELEALPEGLMYCTNLVEVNVSHNAIDKCDVEYIKEIKSLKRLDLSYNRISEFPAELSECRHLEVLKINGNPIGDEGLKALVDASVGEILDYLATKKE